MPGDAIPQTIEEVDSLLGEIESSSGAHQEQTSTHSVQAVQPQQAAVPAAEVQRQEQMVSIVWNGEEKQVPMSQAIKLAQQGYDYSNKMQGLNTEREKFQKSQTEFDALKKEYDSKLSKYGEVDGYIKKDPYWWQHVQDSYKARLSETGQAVQMQVNEQVQGLAQKLAERDAVIDELKTKVDQVGSFVQQSEDKELDSLISGYKQKYSQFDWHSTDQNGLSLEQRILNHAVKNNIGTFTGAANDYLFDEHLKRQEIASKEQVAKSIQAAHKNGWAPANDSPGQDRTVNPAGLIRSKSYDDLAVEGIQELLN